MISAHLIHCGHCRTGQIVALTYADAEQQGWHWSKGQGWHCPLCWEKDQRETVMTTAGKARLAGLTG